MVLTKLQIPMHNKKSIKSLMKCEISLAKLFCKRGTLRIYYGRRLFVFFKNLSKFKMLLMYYIKNYIKIPTKLPVNPLESWKNTARAQIFEINPHNSLFGKRKSCLKK